MSGVLQVSLAVDTSSAKQQLQDLQTQLSNLSAQSININDASLVQANKKVIELQQNLQKAMNPNTGKLDLSRFSAELSKSGTQLKDYATALQNLGPQGSQAFLSLSSAIASAEAPTTRLNAKLLKFGQTIKNTINWQISSSIIHGIMGQFQSAISYAEKLNTSLNNIRIVTGASTDKMAEFAKQANQAAQKLSTTTTAYTNASLIYYQQGLGDKEVAARTETTLKLANVSRQSVEEVSNQMTAIWNNYAEGASNLEHYADVITALGAATASSSSEIATGLEKFAAIGKTVGLSYDYATTALATITAETRQSADTVGTGLRTLFSRLQGLKLGETLEDGVSLNKYSAALQTVGVNIQDQYGKVKDMDQILDELGAKWNTISKEQQIALAQTVGGVRQYTNLIALMDNWSIFQKNLKVAQGADGTLDKQAQIYEESWEAASKRVRAATESIYSSLLDDKAIVKIIDGFAKFLDVIKGITEGLGGMKGIILTISALVTQSMAKNMPTYLKDIGFGFKTLFSNKDLDKIQSDNLDIIKQRMANQSISEAERAQLNKVYNQQYMNQSLLAHQGKMSKEDIAAYQTRMMLQGMADDARIAEVTQQEQARQAAREQMRAMAGIYKAPTQSSINRERAIFEAQRVAAHGRVETAQNGLQEYATLQSDVQKYLSHYRGGNLGKNGLALNERLNQLGFKELPTFEKGTEGGKENISNWMSAFTEAVNKATASLQGMSEAAQKEEAEATRRSSEAPTSPEAARAQAQRQAEVLYAQGKEGDNWEKLGEEGQAKAVAKYREDLSRGMFATGTVYGSNLDAAKRQAEVMAKPMQQTATQIGEVYGARKAIADLRAQAEPEAQKDFAKMSKADQQAFSQQYANRIKQISTTLEKAGGDTAKTSFLQALGFDPAKLDEELAKIDVNSIASALKTKMGDIEKILSGEGGEGTEGEETGGILGKLRAILTGQEEQYAQATGRTSQEDAERIREANQNITNTAESGYNRNQNPTPQSQLPLAKDTAALSTALTSTASGLMMFNNVINSVSSAIDTAFDETADGMTQFGAAIGAVSTALMASGMIQNGANSIAGLLKEGGKAPGWIGLAISAVSAGIGIFKGIQEKREKERKEVNDNKMEQADVAIERLTSVKDLNSAQSNLINAYNETAENLEKGSATLSDLEEAKKTLINSLLESAEGYSNKNAVASALAGDSEAVQKIIDKNRLGLLNSSRASLQAGLEGAGQNLVDAKDWAGFGGQNQVGFRLLNSGSATDFSDETVAIQVLSKHKDFFTQTGNNGFYIDPRKLKTAEQIYAYYQDLLEIQKEMHELGVSSESEYLVNIEKQIGVYQTAAEAYGKYKEQIEELNLETLALGGTVEGQYIGNANLAIKDVKSYNEYRQKLIDAEQQRTGYFDEDSDDYKNMVKAIDAYLGTLPSVTGNDLGNLQYISTGIENVIEYQSKRQNLSEEDQNIMRDNLIKAYEKYGNAIFQVGTRYQIPIDFENPDDKFKSVLNLLQSTAEKNKIQVQIELASNFNLGATSTSEEWAKFVSELDKELWVDIFEKGFNLSTFSGLSPEDRQKMLQQYISALYNKLYEPGGAFDTDTANLYNQQVLDEENVRSTRQKANDIYNEYFHTRGAQAEKRKTKIDTNLPLLESIYNDLYDSETGELKAGAELSDEQKAQLEAIGLSDFDEEKIKQVHEYAEAVQAYNDATLGLEGTNKLIEANKTELEAWLATGFRQKLAKEAEGFGLNYDEIQQYASALRDQGLFQPQDAMSEEEYLSKHESLMQKREELLQQKANGTITEEEYNSQMKETITALQNLEEEYHADIRASEEFAMAQMRLEKGTETLKNNWKGWKKALEETKKGTWANTKEFLALRKALADILNTDPEKLTDSFMAAAKAAGVIEKAADGTEEGVRAFQEFAGAWAWMKHLGSSDEELGNLSPEEFQEKFHKALEAMELDIDKFNAAMDDLMNREPGELIPFDENALVAALASNKELITANLDEINAIAKKFGFQYEWQEMPGTEFDVENITGVPADQVPWGVDNSAIYGNIKLTKDTETGEVHGFKLVARDLGGGSAPPSGGGGGGGKKKTKDHKKPDIGTRYHKIRAKQANNDQNKQEVNRKKERAFGAEKIKQAEKEIELQKEAIDLQRQYVDEINDYLAEDRVKMIEAFTPDKLGFDLGFNLEIDQDGVITNYRQLEEKLLKEENKLIDKYNEGGLDDEAYEEAQKKIDEAREYLKIYEETRDLYEEQWIKLREYLDELADSALELTKLKIDLDVSISDDTLGLLDYMLEKIEDNAYKAAEAISLLGDKTNETLKRVDIYQSGLEEILNSKGLSLDDLANITDEQLINGDFTQAQIDQIREWRDALLDANKELLQMREDIIDKIIDAFNELNDKVQESYDQFDNYNSIIEDYTNITDLLGIRLNQQQKELIKMLGQAALNNAQTQAAAARTIYEEALANQQAAQKAYEQAVANGDTEAMRQWEKVVKETQTVLDDAQQQWLEAWQTALEKAQELYTKAIENTVKAFEESVSGAFGTLDYLQSAFDRMGQTNDQYLQDFEKLYELNKLNRDIQNAIDDTTNIRDKQALRDLQKEINHLQEEGIELSQYDVDALRKKFELEQARLALEDARNAKSEVRLQRDANGNWGYVYTAKEDEVAKAEQEYEDKLYEYQKLNDEYITELQSRVLETQTTYKEALAEIYNDTTLTDAQREARINELNNWLQAELSYFEQQLNNAMDNQQGTLDLYYNKYNNAQAKLADSWDETTLRMLTGANSVAEYMDNVKKSVEDMLQSSSEALSQYNQDVDETNHMAGVETEDYGKEVSDAITTIGKDSAKTREEVAKLSEELRDNFVNSLKEAVNWEEEYANKINAAVEANENFIKSINEMIAKLAELESSNPGLEKARTAYQAAEMAHEEYVKEWKKQHPDEDVVEADIVDEAWEKAKAEWQKYLEEVVGISPIYDTGVPQSLKTGGYTGRWNIASAKTGMYTGSWAGADVEENGRLAFLHQKELVLNADDTQNFLDATQILRTIDLSTNMFSKGLGNIITPWIGDMRQQDLEQNVHIEASFPNVTEHNEIERAFDNLINRAAQYVNRK